MKFDAVSNGRDSTDVSVSVSGPVIEDESDRTPSELLERIRVECDETAAREAAKQTYIAGPPADVAAQVLYSKQNVWVWPCRSSRIMGRLSLTLQRDVLFISWLPYSSPKADQASPSATAVDNGRYAIRPIPISDIEAFRKHTPPIGCHHLVIVLRDGSVHPPLHFFNGGIKAMMAVLREHVRLVKSASDSHTYLVAGDAGPAAPAAPLAADAAAAQGPAYAAATPQWPNAASAVPRAPRDSSAETSGHSTPHTAAGAVAPPDGIEAPWLERSLFALDKFADRSVRGLQKFLFPEHSEVMAAAQQELSMNTAMADLYEKGPLGRARRLRSASYSQPGSRAGSRAGSRRTSASGGADAPSATDASTGVGSFELVDEAAPAAARHRAAPPTPLTADEWTSFLDSSGRLRDAAALRRRVYAGGVAPELRKEVWKFLLGVYEPESSAVARVTRSRELRERYERLAQQWKHIDGEQAAHWAKWRERRSQVEKDVVRTDRDAPLFAATDAPALGVMHRVLLSYIMFNQDLGYSQGMSDLLAPVLLVTHDEVDAFWLFEALLRRVGGNFLLWASLGNTADAAADAVAEKTCCQQQLDGLGRLVQLLDPPLHAAIRAAGCQDYLFCFRWIMVSLKREFALSQVPALWEALWTNPHTPHFHLYVALVLLQYKRKDILQPELHYGRMHEICASLRGTVNLQEALVDAEALALYAGAAGTSCLASVPLPELAIVTPTPRRGGPSRGPAGGDAGPARRASSDVGAAPASAAKAATAATVAQAPSAGDGVPPRLVNGVKTAARSSGESS
eukprot:jgi/Ulvmu1/9540/UM053_0029.1